jgi:hypothetical protein
MVHFTAAMINTENSLMHSSSTDDERTAWSVCDYVRDTVRLSAGAEISFFDIVSRPALQFTQSFIQWVKGGGPFFGVKVAKNVWS